MGFIAVKGFVRLLRVPGNILYPCIFVVASAGCYSLRNNHGDVVIMLAMGILGYFMRKDGWPEAPLALAIVLGPLAEDSFRTALIMYNNDWSIFVRRPISAVILFFTLASLIFPVLRNLGRKGKAPAD